MNTKSAQDQAERERYQDLAAEVREASEADAELDERLQDLAAVMGKDALGEAFAERLEGRLWSALDRAVYLLEARLVSLEVSDVPAYLGDAAGDAEAVRNIAETMDRLGLLKPPPPPVEAPEPDVHEVWVAAGEAGLSTEQCDAIVARLCERYEGRA